MKRFKNRLSLQLLEERAVPAFPASFALGGLDVLVEVHTARELESVLDCEPDLVGVNNRNLKTLAVNLETSYELARLAPKTSTLVSESGIETRAQVDGLREAGFRAFLIGEHFMRAADPGEALGALVR